MHNHSDVLSVMSFNILLDWRKDGPHVWSSRKDLVASTIKHSKADIVGLQEPLKNQLADLLVQMPEYEWVGVARDDGRDQGEYAPILYKKDRLELLQQGTFWLSETPEAAGSLGWDAACVRIATWAKFSDKRNGNTFFHFNTHFDHVGEKAQRESAKLLLQKANKLAGETSVIITGDFNCTEDSQAYKILNGTNHDKGSEIALKDGFYEALDKPEEPAATFHGFGDEEKQRIDYIFLKNAVKVQNYKVLEDKTHSRYASDHYPVIADITIR
jgi:endonuclease/exonuclease/phosphatase family metal-dependent hydrolase